MVASSTLLVKLCSQLNDALQDALSQSMTLWLMLIFQLNSYSCNEHKSHYSISKMLLISAPQNCEFLKCFSTSMMVVQTRKRWRRWTGGLSANTSSFRHSKVVLSQEHLCTIFLNTKLCGHEWTNTLVSNCIVSDWTPSAFPSLENGELIY